MSDKDIERSYEFAKSFLEMPDKVKEIFAQVVYLHANGNLDPVCFGLVDSMERACDECESPIEQILYVALDICSLSRHLSYAFSAQAEIPVGKRTYRADILYEDYNAEPGEDAFGIVIECDGHEFHEKTKEQVAYRNQRDMDLKRAGYDIVHYSGSQIYKDPIKCASEILDYIEQKVGETRNG